MNTVVSGADQQQQVGSPALRTFALALQLVGVVLWATYLVYLPMPQLFQAESALKLAGVVEPGMIFYSLATAGAAFFVWGRLTHYADEGSISLQALLKASALGMLMLALMRLGTTLFPHGPFQQMLAVPIGEFMVFTIIAVMLQRAASA